MDESKFLAQPGKKISLDDFAPDYTNEFKDKDEANEKLQNDIEKISKLQDILYASNKYSLLLIFQALDAAGKDSIIKHVMSGINPQGCEVYSFKAPSSEELDHDFLWRCSKRIPEKGRIGIFNRSYYEEVLVVRVHPELLEYQNLPEIKNTDKFWQHRFDDINSYEKYLTRNGIIILKFYLNVSKDEQKKRFLERIDTPEKNWKFSAGDVKERKFWDDYRHAYEEVFSNTSTDDAPWYIIPADKKWFTRTAVADIIVKRLKDLDLKYPELSEVHKQELQQIRSELV